MKKLLLLIAIFIIYERSEAQQNYCDFEGLKVIHFGAYSGILDSAHINPDPNALNPSPFCAKYIRDTALYDNIRIYPEAKLVDVTPYANNSFSTPKIKLKVYSSAPVGSVIQIQLGLKSDDNYPSGIHSEYTAATSIQNAWQQLTFNYFQSPSGSMAAPTDIDKIVVLFRPNSSGRDTIYIDDLTGPPLLTSGGIHTESSFSARLFQNNPNPAKESTHISFQLNTGGFVSLKVFDILGNSVLTLVDQNLKTGNYSIPVETYTLPNGIYFYVLEMGNLKRSMKMIVSN